MPSTNGATPTPTLAPEPVERLPIQYAALGRHVFPVHGIVDGRCEEVDRIAASIGRYGPATNARAHPTPAQGDDANATIPDERVDGSTDAPPIAETLDAVRAMLARFVVLTPAQVDAIALWTAHTHAFGAAQSTPYLAISSAEKRSGKTRLLEVLDGLVARPWSTGRTSAAALVRMIDKEAPTLLLDESDAAFGGYKEYAEALRGILNTGHRRGGCASLCVGSEVRDFNTFSPKAIAGIGRLPDTVVDRAIPIAMRRRAPGEAVEPFRNRTAVTATQPLRDALAAWAVDAVALLTDAEPSIPDALDDRAADGWEPLLAIADLAGGEWPLRARAAALALSTGIARDDDSIGVRLLSDVRSIFLASATDRLPSADLAAALAEIEDAPWGAWGKHERPLDARALARLLSRYGIRPGSVRLPTGGTLKGYAAEWFDDAWMRYLPALGAANGTPAQAARTALEGTAAGQAATATRAPQGALVPDADHRGGADSHPEAPECAGVPFVTPLAGMDAAEAARIAACRAFE